MALSKTQQQALNKVRAPGNSDLDSSLSESACCFLLSVLTRDLGIACEFPELDSTLELFAQVHPSDLRIDGVLFLPVYERVLEIIPDADSYFLCLAKLHKARLKYASILKAQPFPTVDQVGPRCLLQYGQMTSETLAALLFWRKWLFDLDNRAGQETGYLFEPIIAHSIGGIAFGAKNSPIKRVGEKQGGRQVDCLKEDTKTVYEVKLRVTTAASGQGRWGEELSFPREARSSGYTPILVVLDPTSNPKLSELREAFLASNGEVYQGDEAWAHLESAAGSVMSTFLEKYVRAPIADILSSSPSALPDIALRWHPESIEIRIANEVVSIQRKENTDLQTGVDEIPDDVESGPDLP